MKVAVSTGPPRDRVQLRAETFDEQLAELLTERAAAGRQLFEQCRTAHGMADYRTQRRLGYMEAINDIRRILSIGAE